MVTDATASDVRVRRLEPDDVAAIRTWRYGGRDQVYDPGEDVVPERGYHAVLDATTNELVGYCCFGPEARVPGLHPGDGTLDVGVGLRPDLVGGGWGAVVTRRVLEHGARHHGPDRFRAAILAWNERSLRTLRRRGFRQTGRLEQDDGRVFVVMEGAGHQAIRLARLGHVVTVVDPSSEMLGRASAAIERERADVGSGSAWCRQPARRLPRYLGSGTRSSSATRCCPTWTIPRSSSGRWHPWPRRAGWACRHAPRPART